MKTKITVAALSALVLLSACDTSTNTGSDTPSASNEAAPGNIPDTNTNKATDTPVIPSNEATNMDQGIDPDAAELDNDNTELPDMEGEEFDNETGHNEEAYPDDQMMEEDAGGEVLPPTETDDSTAQSNTK